LRAHTSSQSLRLRLARYAHIMDRSVVDLYRALESAICDRFPGAQKAAEALAGGIADPRTATADAIWGKAWNKPLYANTRVEIGEKWVQKLKPYMSGAWQHWGERRGAFLIAKPGTGSETEAFRVIGPLAQQIRRETGIAMYRLFAIQGAASAVRTRTAKSNAPYADLVNSDPSVMITTVRREMGPGWGHITVLHFLTDLGLACKPDLHLVRTVRHLSPELPLKPQKVPTLNESILINRWARALVEAVDGYFNPARLRYMDKMLMEISRQKLI
jgi:hypothetical protein